MPVLIYTSYDGYLEDPRFSNAEGFVIKSMFFDEFKTKIAEVLRQNPARYEREADKAQSSLMHLCEAPEKHD